MSENSNCATEIHQSIGETNVYVFQQRENRRFVFCYKHIVNFQNVFLNPLSAKSTKWSNTLK